MKMKMKMFQHYNGFNVKFTFDSKSYGVKNPTFYVLDLINFVIIKQ